MAIAKTQDKLPAESDLSKEMESDAGAGISNRAEDNIVPTLKWLQPLSPEVMAGSGQIKGAAPGDFLLANQLVKAADGIWFQPCFMEHKLFEFTPLDRGGGFVAEHAMTVDDLGHPVFDTSNDPILPPGCRKTGLFKYEFSNGNSLIHYRQLAGIVWKDKSGSPYSINFKSTGHTVMREWMTTAGKANMFPNGHQRPLYSHVYQLHTGARRNAKGQWFVLEVGEPVCLDPSIVSKNFFEGTTPTPIMEIVGDPVYAYRIGKALNQAFKRRERAAATPEAERQVEEAM
jgi:hypothetical protein